MRRLKNHQKINIGERIFANLAFLKKLCRSRSDKKKFNLIKNANFDELLSLVEICINILGNNFSLSERQKARLIPFANVIRNLSRKRSEKAVKELIIQNGSGGFLISLLTPIIVEAVRYLATK